MRIKEKLLFLIANIVDNSFRDSIQKQNRYNFNELNRKDIQLRRFIKLYRYAILNIPFYREKYRKAGLSINSINKYTDIEKVPFLTKEEIINRGGITSRGRPVAVLTSGGTSGRKKVDTLLDSDSLIKRYQMLLSILYATGWRLGNSTAALHPIEYSYFISFLASLQDKKIKKMLFDFIQQYIIYGFFHNRRNIYYGRELFEKNNADKYLLRLFDKCPELLITRPDVINVLIKQGKTTGVKFNSIEKVIITGNILTETIKNSIENALKAKVYNVYASTELGYIGVSCKYSGIYVHVDEENYLLEIDNKKDDEIIVTDFNNYMMPMIRYRTSDIGEFININENCECGKSERLLTIKGRTDRYILSNSKTKIYDSSIIEFFEKYPAIWVYQLRKERAGKMRILIRPKDTKNGHIENILDSFSKNFNIDRKRLFFDTGVNLIITSSGKLCSII